MTIQRNLSGKIDESVRRTIVEMDQRIDRIEQMLASVKALALNGGGGGLTPQQRSDVAGLIGALGQGVIGVNQPDPVLQNLPTGNGTVVSVTAGNGLSGGTFTTSGTIALLIGTANVLQKSNGVRLVDSRVVDDGNDISLNSTKKVFLGATQIMTIDDSNGFVLLNMAVLPIVDPGVSGALWNNAGVINVSP